MLAAIIFNTTRNLCYFLLKTFLKVAKQLVILYHKNMKKQQTFTFNEFHKIRKDLLKDCESDYVYFETNSSVLVSAPHGVSQVRLGKFKVAEIGTIPVAKMLASALKTNLIIKTKNNDDDANFTLDCDYRTRIENAVKTQKIKYLIDFHGMAKHRPFDINLGINFGNNIKQDEKMFSSLKNALENAGLNVSIDEPFCAGPTTIAGSFAKNFNIWTIQIEINCAITNETKNIEKCNNLVHALIDWLNRNY